jgi:hypothetical protein
MMRALASRAPYHWWPQGSSGCRASSAAMRPLTISSATASWPSSNPSTTLRGDCWDVSRRSRAVLGPARATRRLGRNQRAALISASALRVCCGTRSAGMVLQTRSHVGSRRRRWTATTARGVAATASRRAGALAFAGSPDSKGLRDACYALALVVQSCQRQYATTRRLPQPWASRRVERGRGDAQGEGIRKAPLAGYRTGRFVLRLATDGGPFCVCAAHLPQTSAAKRRAGPPGKDCRAAWIRVVSGSLLPSRMQERHGPRSHVDGRMQLVSPGRALSDYEHACSWRAQPQRAHLGDARTAIATRRVIGSSAGIGVSPGTRWPAGAEPGGPTGRPRRP